MNKRIFFIFLGILLIGSIFAAASEINQIVKVLVINGTEIMNETNFPECIFESDNISLIANINFKDCVGSVWVSIKINENWTDYTADPFFNNTYLFILNSSLIKGGDNVYWQYFAKDCYNFTYNGSIQEFYVKKNTYLNVTPANPDGLNGWYVTEPVFSLISDESGGDIYYQWDSTGPILYDGPFGLENIPNSPPKESAGILKLNWWTEFECGNESKQNQIFYIDLTDPLITDLNPANNSIVYNNLRPTISAYLDEIWEGNSGINKNNVIMMLDNNTVNANVEGIGDLDAIVSYTPDFDLSLGEHNVSVYAEDNAGRNNTLMWSFEINITPVFTMKIHSPEDGIYDSRRVQFNITISDDVTLEYINYNDKRPRWKRLCKKCDEYGSSRKRMKSLEEGENNITIKATDKFGNTKEENISLFIDSKKPRISKIKPRRNSVVNGSGFYIKYLEDNVKELSINYNPSIILNTEDCISSRRYKECYYDLDLTDYDGQWIEYYFKLIDIANNTKESRKTRVFVDTTPPTLTINMPEDMIDDESYGRKVPFNITISEDVTLEYIDYNDRRPRWRRLCSRCDEYGFNRARTKSFKRGIHNIEIRARDRAGNSDSESISFKVDY